MHILDTEDDIAKLEAEILEKRESVAMLNVRLAEDKTLLLNSFLHRGHQHNDRVDSLLGVCQEFVNKTMGVVEPKCPLETFLKKEGIYDRFMEAFEVDDDYDTLEELVEENQGESIAQAFGWESAINGHDYWSGISDKFEEFYNNLK